MTIEELRLSIRQLTGKEVSSLIEYQITKLVQEGYNLEEIWNCVEYFYVVQHNDIKKIDQYGIGIVRNIRNNAKAYYNNLKLKQQKQQNAAEQFNKTEIKTVEIKPYRRVFHKKRIDIDEL